MVRKIWTESTVTKSVRLRGILAKNATLEVEGRLDHLSLRTQNLHSCILRYILLLSYTQYFKKTVKVSPFDSIFHVKIYFLHRVVRKSFHYISEAECNVECNCLTFEFSNQGGRTHPPPPMLRFLLKCLPSGHFTSILIRSSIFLNMWVREKLVMRSPPHTNYVTFQYWSSYLLMRR